MIFLPDLTDTNLASQMPQHPSIGFGSGGTPGIGGNFDTSQVEMLHPSPIDKVMNLGIMAAWSPP
jgi:hypothetical protein